MSDTGKQSPLGSNMVASLLLNEGLTINPVFSSYVGTSKYNDDYSPGSIVNDTCLKWLTYAINDAYNRGYASGANVTVDTTTYNNLLAIGQSRIPALGNSVPPTYIVNDPSGIWAGEATSGYGVAGDVGPGQDATWIPYDSSNPNVGVTQWGYLRLLALQAFNDFNWNGRLPSATENPGFSYEPAYKDYVSSFMQADSFVKYSNEAIMTLRNSKEFLKGTFSNTNDLITADVSGVSLSSQAFGQDLVNLGKALNLPYITRFGLPSVLLQTLKQNNAITQNLIVGLLGAGLTQAEIDDISLNGPEVATKDQEQKIYGAFLVLTGRSLNDILAPLNCKTQGLTSLADLLNVKKLFPISFTTLTVPIYNANPGPTNSKTYYLLYVNRDMNPQLLAPVIEETVGTIIPPAPPVVVEEEPPVAVIVKAVEANIPPVEVKTTFTPPAPSSGGSGSFSTGGGGGCVVLESYLPLAESQLYLGKEINQAYQMLEGFNVVLCDEKNLQSHVGKVHKAINDYQPCVRVVTETGISLVCSTTAPLFTKEQGFIDAPFVLGKRVAVLRQGVSFFEEVIDVKDVGMKFVRVIDTGNNSFWAGEKEGSYILHHNTNIYKEFARVVKK